MFNIIFDDIKESSVLDLFAGSGAIGLEFASRGAKKVIMCDNSRKACQIIKQNIEKTHLQEKVELLNLEYIDAIRKINSQNFDIIYLDPPYKTDYIKNAINELIKQNLITQNTLIIAETDEEEKIIEQIKEIPKIEIIDKRKYGRAHILFLRKISRKEE